MKATFLAATVLLGASVAFAQAAPETPFIAKAVQGDIAETMMGELAAKQGSTPDVRAYGKMLATDHGKHRVTAVALAKSMSVTPPTAANAEQQAAYTELKGKTGKEFDAAFVDHMIMDHDKDISEYQKQYAEGKGRLPAFAVKTLPVLKKHLGVAQGLKAKA